MTVVRLELDVPDDEASDLGTALLRAANMIFRDREPAAARVTILSDFEAKREKAMLAAAQYLYPSLPGTEQL